MAVFYLLWLIKCYEGNVKVCVEVSLLLDEVIGLIIVVLKYGFFLFIILWIFFWVVMGFFFLGLLSYFLVYDKF